MNSHEGARRPEQRGARSVACHVGRGAESCPTPAATFVIRIWNHKPEPVELHQNGVLVGAVRARGDSRFDPFSGDRCDFPGLTIRDSGGKECNAGASGSYADHDLGQVFEIEIGIN